MNSNAVIVAFQKHWIVWKSRKPSESQQVVCGVFQKHWIVWKILMIKELLPIYLYPVSEALDSVEDIML